MVVVACSGAWGWEHGVVLRAVWGKDAGVGWGGRGSPFEEAPPLPLLFTSFTFKERKEGRR